MPNFMYDYDEGFGRKITSLLQKSQQRGIGSEPFTGVADPQGDETGVAHGLSLSELCGFIRTFGDSFQRGWVRVRRR
jgi:hypothetical protein